MIDRHRMVQTEVMRKRLETLKMAILESMDYTPHATAVAVLAERFVGACKFEKFEFERAMEELKKAGDLFEHNGFVVKVRKTE